MTGPIVEGPGGPPGGSMMRDRERARQLATSTVAIAMGLAGLTLVALAVALVVRGGGALILLAIIVGGLGIALGTVGFFFQLVPMKLDELAAQKRDHDRRMREK